MTSLFDKALAPLFKDVVYAQPGAYSGSGKFIPSGAVITIKCRCKGGDNLAMNKAGQEVVSTVHFVTDRVYGLTTEMSFTFPGDLKPSDPRAIQVSRPRDENGPHHEKVFFQ